MRKVGLGVGGDSQEQNSEFRLLALLLPAPYGT
jgi:hypothetical protein